MTKLLASSSLIALLVISSFTSTSPQSAIEDLKAKADRIVAPLSEARDDRLQQVAKFDHQVTGVTVSEDWRIFVNFPRWSEDVPVSVADVMNDGSVKPYPNDEWNNWRNVRMAAVSPNDHFITAQSVVTDGRGSLWVVDAAAPNSGGVTAFTRAPAKAVVAEGGAVMRDDINVLEVIAEKLDLTWWSSYRRTPGGLNSHRMKS